MRRGTTRRSNKAPRLEGLPSSSSVSVEDVPIPHIGSPDAEISEWIKNNQDIVNEFLETARPSSSQCIRCQQPAVYQCSSCSHSKMMCQACMVSSHAEDPLHSVEKWNGTSFEETTLSALGLVVQLGHDGGDACPNPSPLQDLVVFDLCGAYRLVVRYCSCGGPADSLPWRTQLMRVRWFPAAVDRPSAAFTFHLLEFFHALENKNNSKQHEFYHAIIHSAAAAGLDPKIYLYDEIEAVFIFWGMLQSDLQLLKQTGSRNARPGPSGSTATA